MIEFEKEKEYKLFRQSFEDAKRIAKCTGVNRKEMKIRFEIGNQVIVYDLKNGDKGEYAVAPFGYEYYLNIFASDVNTENEKNINMSIIDRVTRTEIDFYTIKENELEQEIKELIEQKKNYLDCDIKANGETILTF